jgi:hypothetical protein
VPADDPLLPLIETIGGFAETAASPLAAAAVLAAAALARRPAHARLAAGGLGAAMAVPAVADGAGWLAGALIAASVLACLVQAELCLRLVLPALRWGGGLGRGLGWPRRRPGGSKLAG